MAVEKVVVVDKKSDRAERELKQANQLFNAIFNAAQTGLIILHRESGQIMDVNPMAGKILGLTVDELLGVQIANHLPPKGNDGCPLLTETSEDASGTMQLVRHNGEKVPVMFSSTFLPAEHGGLMVISFTDISEQLAAEEQLRESNQKLKDSKDRIVQSEKLASIGQLAAGVAHEINNPVGYVTSNLGTISDYI